METPPKFSEVMAVGFVVFVLGAVTLGYVYSAASLVHKHPLAMTLHALSYAALLCMLLPPTERHRAKRQDDEVMGAVAEGFYSRARRRTTGNHQRKYEKPSPHHHNNEGGSAIPLEATHIRPPSERERGVSHGGTGVSRIRTPCCRKRSA